MHTYFTAEKQLNQLIINHKRMRPRYVYSHTKQRVHDRFVNAHAGEETLDDDIVKTDCMINAYKQEVCKYCKGYFCEMSGNKTVFSCVEVVEY
jgi:hypothetical protein